MTEDTYSFFLRRVWLLGLPLVLQSLFFSSGGFIDNLMVSQLGTQEVAASSIGARVFWLAGIFIWGMGTGMGVILAQYWGAKDEVGLRRNFALGATFSTLASMLIFLFVWFFPTAIPSLFKATGETATLAADYLQIISVALLLAGPTISMDSALRSLGKTKVTLYMSIVEIGFNIGLSFVLIFGHLGFPEMGLIGAGIGTLSARILRVVISLITIYVSTPVLILTRKDFAFRSSTLSRYLNITAPIIAGSLMWSGGIFTYQLIMGRMGETELATMAIISSLEALSLCIASGLSSATAIVIGNALGANKLAISEKYARYALKTAVIVGLVCAAIILSVQSHVLSLYSEVSDDVLSLAALCFPVLALSALVRNINITLIVGVLRAGGDAKFCMNMDVVCQWIWAVPMTALAAMWFELPLQYVFLMMTSEEIVKLYPAIKRVFGNKWVNNLTEEKPASA
ncbi:MATE family efflux transporter [Enterovibrio calviensis]|uniref:MATE family efflux transporter n=1 Tax=Enterovibrio calviensis TaxID=91359 RepID=UPI00047F83A7|nr:MATE family efflux transporter [Enterovibrio calviensis]